MSEQILACPGCGTVLQVTYIRRGVLTDVKGTHVVEREAWQARCVECHYSRVAASELQLISSIREHSA